MCNALIINGTNMSLIVPDGIPFTDLSFALNDNAVSITGQDMAVTVPHETNPSNLISTFITSGISLVIDGFFQVSSQTSTDFIYPVILVFRNGVIIIICHMHHTPICR